MKGQSTSRTTAIHHGRIWANGGGGGRDALEGKGHQRWPQRWLVRRSEEVAEAVRGSYYRLRMPLSLALAVRETAAGHRLGELEGAGPSNASLGQGQTVT